MNPDALWPQVQEGAGSIVSIRPGTEYVVHIPYVFNGNEEVYEREITDRSFTLLVSRMVQRKSVRQEYAKNSGADVVLDPNECDVVEEIKKRTDGFGADVAFECTGAEAVFHKLLDAVHVGGTVVVTSIWEKPVQLDLNDVCIPEKKVVGSIAYCGSDFDNVIELLSSGKIPANGFITKKIALDDIVEEGFKTLTGPEKKKQVKIIVSNNAEELATV